MVPRRAYRLPVSALLLAVQGLLGCSARPAGDPPASSTRSALVSPPAPHVGPEISVGEPLFVATPYDDKNPTVAWDGDGTWLVVWEGTGYGGSVVMTRVDATGAVLDPGGIAIDVVGYQPAAAFDGTNFVVVWHEYRAGGWDVYGARVRPDGVVLDPTGIPISTASSDQFSPSAVYDGTSTVVVWSDWRNGRSDLYGARVAPGGQVLDPDGFLVASSVGWGAGLVRFGEGSLITWVDASDDVDGDIYAARLDATGIVLDVGGFPVSTALGGQIQPVAAPLGAGVIVVWNDDRDPMAPSGHSALYGARIGADGAVLDADGIQLVTPSRRTGSPHAVRDGQDVLVAWRDIPGALHALRVGPGGAVLDTAPIHLPGNHSQRTAFAEGAASTFLVWDEVAARDPYAIESNVLGARIDRSGVVLDSSPVVLSTTPADRNSPGACAAGDQFLVAWIDRRDVTSQRPSLYAARVDATGRVLDPDGILLDEDLPNPFDAPAIASDGTNWFVAWQTGSDLPVLAVAHIGAGGELLAPGVRTIRGSTIAVSAPGIAFDGQDFLLAWLEGANEVHGARMNPAGTLLDPDGFLISDAPNTLAQGAPQVVAGPSGFLVAWADERAGAFDLDTYAARVTSSGTVLDPNGILVGSGESHQLPTAVASDGDQWFVLYYHLVAEEFRGTRVSANGTVLGNQFVSDIRGQFAALIHDGSTFLGLFNDLTRYPESDILGLRITSNGTLLDQSPFLFSDGGRRQYRPAVARNASGTLLVAYEAERGVDFTIKARLIAPCNEQPGGCFTDAGEGGASGESQTGGTSAGGASGGSTSSGGAPNAGSSNAGESSGGARGGGPATGQAGESGGDTSGGGSSGIPGRGGQGSGGGGAGASGAGSSARGGSQSSASGRESTEASGCGCRVPSSKTLGGGWVVGLVLVWACRARRRATKKSDHGQFTARVQAPAAISSPS